MQQSTSLASALSPWTVAPDLSRPQGDPRPTTTYALVNLTAPPTPAANFALGAGIAVGGVTAAGLIYYLLNRKRSN
jgi:hypothetical protein